MADLDVEYPDTWDVIVTNPATRAARYKKATAESLATLCSDANITSAYTDYEKLRALREWWLVVRLEGEIRVRDALTEQWEKDEKRDGVHRDGVAYTTALTNDIHTLLLPQSLSQGFIAFTFDDVVGKRLYADIKRYDTALLICMEACFKRAPLDDAANYVSYEYDPARQLVGNVSARAMSHRLLAHDPDESNMRPHDVGIKSDGTGGYFPMQDITAIEGMTGRQTVNAIFKHLCPRGIGQNIRNVAKATVYAWVSEMTRTRAHLRVRTLVERTRVGLMSHYIVQDDTLGSVFPTTTDAITVQWSKLAANDAYNATDKFTRSVIMSVEKLVLGRTTVDAERANPLTSPIVVYDGKLRAASVFYTPATFPLIVACAVCVVYLAKLRINGIMYGTEAMHREPTNTEVVLTSLMMTPYEAGLVSYSAYTIHKLNMTMAGMCMTHPDNKTDWSPHMMESIRCATWRETAKKLIIAWREIDSPVADKWMRGLKAALLAIDQHPPPP